MQISFQALKNAFLSNSSYSVNAYCTSNTHKKVHNTATASYSSLKLCLQVENIQKTTITP